ncbi:kinase-like domain-containing protein [Dunaliella salina]|uniref:Kinase-like domain-containing protein n=1 Tax=Dunaliella salina TaxID=3046 RepID=A0ABQ7GV80_DUNSA|nr:kinase-like domain-containing protein [Dunaliella salina]|eukprot:KAF5838517.1 kinase-like domain-containing protein [Dunaliella salina]
MPGAAAVQAFKRAGSRAAGLEVGPCNIPSSEWELNGMHVQYGKRIAVGGFAEVFAGKYLGTLVAIKKLLATDPDAVRHFAHEVRVLARLRHPNLILFIGYCLRPEPAILYEFMPRGSLFNIMRQVCFHCSGFQGFRVQGCVARGMAYLHSRNPPILHLDLKSPNILVDAQWRIKVCDFGLSAVRRQAFLSSACAGGTPEWMAPEMLRCEDYDEKADVWSFGVVLWELLTGEVPFVDLSPMQVVGMVGFKRQSLSPPGQGDTTLQQLCVMCMTQDPAERPSFTAILDCMDKAYHHGSSSGIGSMPNACQTNGDGPQHQAQDGHAARQAPRLKLIEAGAASSAGGGQQCGGGVEKARVQEAVAACAQGAPHAASGSSVQDPAQQQPHAVHGTLRPASSSKTPHQNPGESSQPSKSRRLDKGHRSPAGRRLDEGAALRHAGTAVNHGQTDQDYLSPGKHEKDAAIL